MEETASGVPVALEALGDGEVGVKIIKDPARPGGQPGSGAMGSMGGATWRSFTLDKALGPSTTQEEVFRQVHFVIRVGGGGEGRSTPHVLQRWRCIRSYENCIVSEVNHADCVQDDVFPS